VSCLVRKRCLWALWADPNPIGNRLLLRAPGWIQASRFSILSLRAGRSSPLRWSKERSMVATMHVLRTTNHHCLCRSSPPV
jgi:hypothetical protein